MKAFVLQDSICCRSVCQEVFFFRIVVARNKAYEDVPVVLGFARLQMTQNILLFCFPWVKKCLLSSTLITTCFHGTFSTALKTFILVHSQEENDTV